MRQNTWLNESQIQLLRELEDRSYLDISDLKERIDDARVLLKEKLARFRVVQEPWGVEFLLERKEE